MGRARAGRVRVGRVRAGRVRAGCVRAGQEFTSRLLRRAQDAILVSII